MLSDIHTEYEEREPRDRGVERVLVADEEFVREGERVERTTELRFLEDGGVHITQQMQGCHDSLTLNSDVAWRLRRGLETDDVE